MYPWAIAYGFCAGAVASLVQAGIVSLYAGSESKGLGQRIGMCFAFVGFAGLIGAPVGGELIKAGPGRGRGGKGEETFLWMQVFTGAMMMCGAVGLVGARVWRTGWGLRRWV